MTSTLALTRHDEADHKIDKTWVVLVEAARTGSTGTINRHELATLLEALHPGSRGGALHSADRYAVQLTATGSDPADALTSVLSKWAEAVRELALPGWEIVRTEVLRPTELERDLMSIHAAERIHPG